jgi:hypothetical protein
VADAKARMEETPALGGLGVTLLGSRPMLGIDGNTASADIEPTALRSVGTRSKWTLWRSMEVARPVSLSVKIESGSKGCCFGRQPHADSLRMIMLPPPR